MCRMKIWKKLVLNILTVRQRQKKHSIIGNAYILHQTKNNCPIEIGNMLYFFFVLEMFLSHIMEDKQKILRLTSGCHAG